MAISCSGFNTIALFSRRIIKIKNALVNASLVFWFCFAEMICSGTWQLSHGRLPNIWLTGEHSDPIGTIRTQAYGLLKKGPRPCKRFLRLLPPQSPCGFSALARLYYLSAPNQNRHATQATDLGVRESLNGWKKWRIEKYSRHFPARLDFPSPPSQYLPLWVYEDELLPAFNGNRYVIWSWINSLVVLIGEQITECWPLSSAVATSAENRCVPFIYFHIPPYLKEFFRETDRCNNYASWRKTFYKYIRAYYHPVAPGAG